MKFYDIWNLFWLGHVSLFRNTKSRHITIEEKDLGESAGIKKISSEGIKTVQKQRTALLGP